MPQRKNPSQKSTARPAPERLFARLLLQWNEQHNRRQMPWKGEKDPYKIWLSEIILQQTRVEQGLKYYENFITTFPDVQRLAAAPEEKVFKLWEGLGYYSRCRNLIASARYIAGELKGEFPRDYESILALKGVGAYTASAIASFAYNQPYAVLDGNVFRVLSRIYGIETPVDSTAGKKEFTALAQQNLPLDQPAAYNQAIMDFGAVICKPVPECSTCFYNQHCIAFLEGKQDLLPVKEKKVQLRERWMNYIVLKHKDHFAIHQRLGKDIWQQLFEFALIETPAHTNPKQVLKLAEKQYGIAGYKVLQTVPGIRQKLSHQALSFQFVVVELTQKHDIPTFRWINRSELIAIAFPRTLQQFIKDNL